METVQPTVVVTLRAGPVDSPGLQMLVGSMQAMSHMKCGVVRTVVVLAHLVLLGRHALHAHSCSTVAVQAEVMVGNGRRLGWPLEQVVVGKMQAGQLIKPVGVTVTVFEGTQGVSA